MLKLPSIFFQKKLVPVIHFSENFTRRFSLELQNFGTTFLTI